MWGGDLLAIEREGKPFKCANVGMMYLSIKLNYQNKKDKIKSEAKRLYDRFDKTDTGEFELSEEEVLNYKECDAIIIIPKTKDTFITNKYWKEGIRSGFSILNKEISNETTTR